MRAPHPRKPPSGSCDRRSLRVTFHSVISYEKAPLGRILRNFRLRMRTPFQGSSSGSRDQIRSLPVAMVLVLLYYILYYYYNKKKAREAEKKRGKMTSFPVTWLTSLTVTSLPVTHAQWSNPLQILLCSHIYILLIYFLYYVKLSKLKLENGRHVLCLLSGVWLVHPNCSEVEHCINFPPTLSYLYFDQHTYNNASCS